MAPVMGFSVLLCFLVTALTPSRGSQAYSEIRYECGPHGKFEYCVDDIPGCVVGCHCHPGYYFDTETKICELNVKLTQHSRQQYLAEPIRGYDHPAITTELPYPTATTYSNENDYEIKKDTDEIGDWLYNQFFKAIENQVISNSNSTKSINNVIPLTRRSEGGPVINEVKKKKRKTIRSHRKRKHMKGRRLKKLLRITEDDSLFDSDSDSESGYSDSDSSDYSDDSSEESTDLSDERKSSGTDSSEHKDHGHKKVVIFNRRPKPPLPSFIFMPNVDTPFYPPIGLPPPPLLPMFPMPMVPPPPPPPMIPLPPPPMIPLPPIIPTPPAPPPQSTAPSQNKKDDNTNNTTTKGPDTNGRRDRVVKPLKKPNLQQNIGRASEPGKHKNFKRAGSKSRLIQKIMERLKVNRRNNLSPSDVKSLDEFQDQDFQDIDDIPNSLEFYTPHKRSPKKHQDEDHTPEIEDVDFKYLSELIHGVNNSAAKRRSPFNLNDDVKGLHKRRLPHPSRRNFDADHLIPEVHTPSTDDIYYSNLGRQMASMVRNADAEVFPQLNKKLEHVNRQVPFHSVLNENSHFPRSLWERSVRSLLPRHGPFSEYLDESRTLKHSNEKSLINLENEVAIVASTPRPLSLQDLENMLSTVQKVHAHDKFRQPLTSTKQSNVSLNVNLLPKHVRSASPNKFLFETPIKVELQTELPRVYLEPNLALVANTTSVLHEPEKKYNIPYKDYWFSNLNVKPIQSNTRPRPVFDQTSKPIRENQTYYPYSLGQTFVDIVQPKPTEANTPREQYLQYQNSVPLAKQIIPKINEPVKYKSLNYFSGDKHYLYEAASYPFLTPFKTQISKRINKPSYFHRHLHHFEYFD